MNTSCLAVRCSVLFWGTLASCTEPYFLDAPDVDLAVPSEAQLEDRHQQFLQGKEKHHGDPCAVAHVAMEDHLTTPWRGRPYRPQDYEFRERDPQRAEWGSYVIRGDYDSAGREYRARVKVRRYKEIWYPVQVSHFLRLEMPHERLDNDSKPPDVH